MAVFKDLKALLRMMISWENELTDFYDVAYIALKKEKSKRIVALLRENHQFNLKILKEINIEDYGKDEWIKYVPDYNIKDLLPIGKITRESSPSDIINKICECEERIKSFYSTISEKIITLDEKELFDSLVNFKNCQIFRIKQLIEYF